MSKYLTHPRTLINYKLPFMSKTSAEFQVILHAKMAMPDLQRYP